MKEGFLLVAVNAKYIHSNLAVYSLQAAAAREGILVDLVEFTINQYVEEILQELYQREPEVLFFSCYVWNWEYVRELAAECAKILPGVPVWVGGPEVSYEPVRVLEENPAITGVLLGEGEESFPRLLRYYRKNLEDKRERRRRGEEGVWGKILGAETESSREREKEQGDLGIRDGLAFWQNGIQVYPQMKLPNLNEIPFPYKNLGDFSHKILYYESSRGCPFSCSYCLSSIDKRVRFRDLELVRRELKAFLEAGVAQVKFVDRTFNCKESHALAVWQYLLDHDNGVTNFHFEIAADLLTEAELEILRRLRPGQVQLEIGIQSTCKETLEQIYRRMDLALVEKRVRQVKSFGNIHQHLDLIAGLPCEGLERFARSFDRVFALRPEQLQLGFLKVLKGTRMQEDAEKYGILYRDKPPYEVLSTRWLHYGELLRLKKVEQMVELYYNSGQFSLTLDRLMTFWESAFVFFEELAAYYQDHGWDRIQHTRVRRYEILLDFIRERHLEEEHFQELLTMDYYLREAAKTRPGFSRDLTPWKEQIRLLQKQYGKEKHVEVRAFDEGGNRQEPAFVVFDYQRRSPLTKDAAVFAAEL